LLYGDILLSEIAKYCRKRFITGQEIIINGIVSEQYPSFRNSGVLIVIDRDKNMVKITKTQTMPTHEVSEFFNPIMFNIINLSTSTQSPTHDDLDDLLNDLDDI